MDLGEVSEVGCVGARKELDNSVVCKFRAGNPSL